VKQLEVGAKSLGRMIRVQRSRSLGPMGSAGSDLDHPSTERREELHAHFSYFPSSNVCLCLVGRRNMSFRIDVGIDELFNPFYVTVV